MTFVDEKLALLKAECHDILDIGSGPSSVLRIFFAGRNYKSVDIDPHSNADIITDAHTLAPVVDASVDAIVSFNLLEHLHSPQQAADAMHRVLKPNDGRLLLSTPFLHPYHGGNCPDYYRFSKDGLRYLFREFRDVTIVNDGGFFYAMQYFLPAQLDWARPAFRLFDRLLTARRASGHATIIWART